MQCFGNSLKGFDLSLPHFIVAVIMLTFAPLSGCTENESKAEQLRPYNSEVFQKRQKKTKCDFEREDVAINSGYWGKGIDCGRNGKIDQAVKYYELASLYGNAFSSVDLAARFETGDGVEKDSRKAYFYHTHVIERLYQGHPNWTEFSQERVRLSGHEPHVSWKKLIDDTNKAQARLSPHLSPEDYEWIDAELERHRVWFDNYLKRAKRVKTE